MRNYLYTTKIQSLLSIFIFFLFSLVSFLIYTGYNIFSNQSYNDWRIFEVVTLISLSLYAVLFHHSFSSLYHNRLLYFSVVLFILFGCISSFSNAQYTSRALRDWSLYSSMIFGIISLAYIIHIHQKWAKYTLTFMCCAPTIFIIGFLYQIFFYFAVPIDPKPSVMQTWQVQFVNDRIFGDTALPIIFMLAALITITENLRLRRFLFVLCVAESIMLMFSGGRGIIISCVMSITLVFLLNKVARKALIYFTLNLIFSFLMGLLLVNLLSGDLSQGTIFRADSSGRLVIIKEALHNFINHPILGIGPAQSEFIYNEVILSHPHNLFIQILSEWGVIAFIALIILLSIVLFRLIPLIRKEKNPFNVFIFTGAVAFLINCNFNGAHIYSSSQIYGLFIFSWLLSLYINPKINIESNQQNAVITYVLPLATLIPSLVLVATTYLALGCGGNNVPAEASYGGPRFWLADSPHDDAICKPFSEINFAFKDGK